MVTVVGGLALTLERRLLVLRLEFFRFVISRALVVACPDVRTHGADFDVIAATVSRVKS
jgi:hypothetical protein